MCINSYLNEELLIFLKNCVLEKYSSQAKISENLSLVSIVSLLYRLNEDRPIKLDSDNFPDFLDRSNVNFIIEASKLNLEIELNNEHLREFMAEKLIKSGKLETAL